MGSLLKPLNAMSVTTTQDGHAPNSTRPYTQTANGAKISLEDWWNNTGNDIYTNVVNSGNIKTAPSKQTTPNSEGLDAWASKLDQWGTKLNELKSKPTNSPLSTPTLGLPSKTQGLDFNDTRAVQQWLTDNGFNTKGIDGMYGANTKAAIDELLSSNEFVLTQAEKEAFRNFQNNATFVRAKQPAKVEIPAQSVVSNLTATPPVIDPEKQKRIDTYTKAGYIKHQNNGLTYYVDPKTNIGYYDNGRVTRNNTQGTVQEDGSITWDNFNFNNFGLDNNLKYTTIGEKKYFRWDPSGHGDFYIGENGKIYRVRIGGGLGDEITSFTSDQQMSNYADLYNKMHPEKPARIVNGVLIKKHQQGGNMEQQEQQEFMKFLIEDALAQGLQIQTEDDVKSYLSQLGEEGIKAKYQQFMQMKGQTPSAKLGSKLNYIKSLKGDCPDDEEVVYFKKGGMICKACEKKKQGAKLEQSKINPVEEFKKGRKTKKC